MLLLDAVGPILVEQAAPAPEENLMQVDMQDSVNTMRQSANAAVASMGAMFSSLSNPTSLILQKCSKQLING